MTHTEQRLGPPMLDAVIFDMDGVIADTEPFHTQAYVEVFRSFGIHITESQYRKTITEGGKRIATWFVELGGESKHVDELYRQKDQVYLPLVRGKGSPRPGLLTLLRELRERGVACAVATSARRINADFVLDLFDLRGFFSVILGLEDVTRVKPHPEVFLLALERLPAQPDRTIVLEDAPKGVRAALDAGIPVVATPTSWTRHCRFDGAALVVESLEELTVARLNGLLNR